MRIVGIVHTKNEERNLARALRSLEPICSSVLVADMQSSDNTRSLALSLGAQVLDVPDFGYADPAWAIALDAVEADWVLRIDADEFLPPALCSRLIAVAQTDAADVVDIARLNFMFGEALRATGWAPKSDRHYFFFKPQHLQSVPAELTKVHTVMGPLEGARVLKLPAEDNLSVWHFNYTDWTHFVTKMNRYTSLEATQGGHGTRSDLRSLGRSLVREIRDRGIKGKAWRDGYRGAGLVAMMCTYRTLVWLKSRQLDSVGDEEAIRARYDRISATQLDPGECEIPG